MKGTQKSKKEDPKSSANRIRRCTKPYLVEGIAAGLLDFGLFLLLFVLIGALDKDFHSYLILPGVGLAIALLWDMKTVYPCVLDRILQREETSVLTLEDIGTDISYTDKFSRPDMAFFPSLLTTWYYPKEWRMYRVKLIFQNEAQQKRKLRLVWSEKHGQFAFWDDLRILQNKLDERVTFQVSWCRYSKVLLSIRVHSIPDAYTKKQQEWICGQVSDTFRWMLSKKVIGS